MKRHHLQRSHHAHCRTPGREFPLTLPSPPSDGGEGVICQTLELRLLEFGSYSTPSPPIGWGRGQGEGEFKDAGTSEMHPPSARRVHID